MGWLPSSINPEGAGTASHTVQGRPNGCDPMKPGRDKERWEDESNDQQAREKRERESEHREKRARLQQQSHPPHQLNKQGYQQASRQSERSLNGVARWHTTSKRQFTKKKKKATVP